MKWNCYILGSMLSLTLLFTGCLSDEPNLPCPFGSEALLKLNVPGVETKARTYALSETDEHRLASVNILVFKDNNTGSDNETFVYAATPASIDNASGTYNKTIKVSFRGSGTAKHRIVLLANMRDKITNFDDIIEGFTTATTKQDALNQIRLANNGLWAAPGSTIPMWGEMEEAVVINDNTVYTAIDMLRSLAGIDVGINMNATGTPQGLGDLFKLTRARVYNSNNLALGAPYAVNYRFGKVSLPSVPASPAPGKNGFIEYASVSPDGLGIAREIYTAEFDNKNTSVKNSRLCLVVAGYYTAPGSGSVNTTTESWYRIDFEDEAGNALDILRNYRYLVNIKEASGAGSATPEEAFAQPSSYLGVEVIPWDEYAYGAIAMGDYTLELSHKLYTCDYSMQTLGSASTPPVFSVTTNYSQGWEVAKITEIVNGVEVDQPEPTWLKLSGGRVSGDMGTTASAINVEKHTGIAPRIGKIYITAGRWTQVVTVEQSPYQGIDVNPSNCYIVQPNGRGINIPVSQANNAIGGTIGASDELTAELLWIDYAEGMTSVSGNVNTGIEDIRMLGRGDTARILVIPGNKEANAVVVVKAVGVIKWSWHIWVTNYNPNALANYLLPLTDNSYPVPGGVVYGNYTGTQNIPAGYDPQTFGPGSWSYAPAVMDRALGNIGSSNGGMASSYAKTGLFYQWGRKDPFIAANTALSGSTTTIVPIYNAAGTQISFTNISGGGLAATIASPGALYYNYKADNGSWGYPVNSNPWAIYPWEGNAGKSAYDPCPEGWMVERHGFWNHHVIDGNMNTMDAETPGQFINHTFAPNFGYLPLAGYIVPGMSSNTYTDVMQNSTLWVATGKISGNAIAGDAYCFMVNFSASPRQQPEGALNRSYGAQVRCMREYKF